MENAQPIQHESCEDGGELKKKEKQKDYRPSYIHPMLSRVTYQALKPNS